MRALNSKEAVILITNLSTDETLIPQQEIITDVTQMRTVANVHESLVSNVWQAKSGEECQVSNVW